MRDGAIRHPAYVEIPDSKTEGVRAYREAEVPHPLQLAFLEVEGERAYVEHLRALLTAGRTDEADRILTADLAGFGGAIARLAQALPPAAVTLEGWGDLLPILDEFEGPPITTLTVGLTNEPDLVFDSGRLHEPALLLGLYSDDAFAFSAASREALLAECAADMPGWAGHEEDVEFYADIAGLADLNTALVQCKHRYFLRDGRDGGVAGRAPGGYVEYVLGCWLRATRFVQALERAVADDGLPDGARVIAGSVGLDTDFATVIEPKRQATAGRTTSAAPAPVAMLSVKPWVPREDPTVAAPASGSTLRQRLGTAESAPQPLVAPKPANAAAPLPESTPPARLGFFARLFARRRRR